MVAFSITIGAHFIEILALRGLTLILGIVVIISTSPQAQAAQIDLLANELLSWIVRNSDLETAHVPEIRVGSSNSISSKVSNGQIGDVMAAYDTDNRVVWVSEGLDIRTTRGQSILLHELIHHLQIVNGVPVPCIAQLNSLAYALQLQWLNEEGVEDAKTLAGVNDAMIFQNSACEDPFGALPWQ